MSDEDEQQLGSRRDSKHDNDNRRRLNEVKNQLQQLTRSKKKYDEEKLRQDNEFLQSEMTDLRNSILDVNKDINKQIQIKRDLHVEIANLQSRSRFRYANSTIALKDKRRYEEELKKKNKPAEYYDLARREIGAIEAALPILREEDDLRARLKQAEDARQAAINKRKKLEDNLNTNIRRHAENKQLLSETAEKLPEIEETIQNLRTERDHLILLTNSPNKNRKKLHLKFSPNQQSRDTDTLTADEPTIIEILTSSIEENFQNDKVQYEDQINKINTLINYLRDKLIEHGLNTCGTPSTELQSPFYQPITTLDGQTVLSSFIDEPNSDNSSIIKNDNTHQATTIAIKLPRNFLPLELDTSGTHEIIHSPYYDANEYEYKKEISSDIVNKYGGQAKKLKQANGKKNKRNRKSFAITHNPQMMILYNNVRSSTGSPDALPTLPMYEYELRNAIQSLEFLKQNLESYLRELSYNLKVDTEESIMNALKLKSTSENNEDEDVLDSALDTFSETSSLIEPVNHENEFVPLLPKLLNVHEINSSASSDDKRTICSTSPPPSSNHSDSKVKDEKVKESQDSTIDENINLNILQITTNLNQIDRQISDEGYRSVRNEKQVQESTKKASSHNSPLLNRSKSYDCTEKVDKWLTSTRSGCSALSLPKLDVSNNEFQSTDMDDNDDL